MFFLIYNGDSKISKVDGRVSSIEIIQLFENGASLF